MVLKDSKKGDGGIWKIYRDSRKVKEEEKEREELKEIQDKNKNFQGFKRKFSNKNLAFYKHGFAIAREEFSKLQGLQKSSERWALWGIYLMKSKKEFSNEIFYKD